MSKKYIRIFILIFIYKTNHRDKKLSQKSKTKEVQTMKKILTAITATAILATGAF